MKVEFKDFFSALLKDGVFNPELKYDDAGFFGLRHSLHTPHYADRLHEVLCENVSDTIEYKGALYSMAGGSLVSNKPFNVKGFIGDMDGFSAKAKESMLKDIANFKGMLKAWDDVNSFYGAISSHSAVKLQYQYFYADEFIAALVIDWVEKAAEYIRDSLAYNLIHKNVFELPCPKFVCKNLFGIDNFTKFDSVDKFSKVVDAVCFEKLKDYMVSNFDEGETNKKAYQTEAYNLCDAFVAKTTHKAFDKYSLSYRPANYSWEDQTVGQHTFKDWFKSLRIACIDQGLGDWYSDFALGCATEFSNLVAGDSVVCGGVQIRVYKEHITLSLPKKVSTAIGIFINKYARETLERKVA